MSKSKQAATPSEGIYYVVPDKAGHVTVLSQRADEVDEPAHMFFWEKVLRQVAAGYGLPAHELEDLKTNYMAVPRGRVQKEIDKTTFQPTGRYVILHGGDVPVSTIQYAVLQDFGLVPLSAEKRVTWKVEAHEKMDPEDVAALKSAVDTKPVKKR